MPREMTTKGGQDVLFGQSGQFQDIYYEDQVRAWAEGRTYPFPFTARAVDAAAVSVLRLEP